MEESAKQVASCIMLIVAIALSIIATGVVWILSPHETGDAITAIGVGLVTAPVAVVAQSAVLMAVWK